MCRLGRGCCREAFILIPGLAALKITFFGLTLSSSWGNGHATPYRAILRALHRCGHQTTFFERDVPYYAARRDFSTCDYTDLVLYRSWDEVRAKALRSAADSDAVIVGSYCPEGARISDEVLGLGRPLRVYYDLDTPITLAGLETGREEHLSPAQIPEFDLYMSFTGGGILQELEERWGARMARPLYGCVDPEIHARVAPKPEYGCDLSYMGTYAADRQQKLDALFLEPSRRRTEMKFVLAGSLYPWQWQWGENVRRFEHIAPEEHPTFYSSSRLTLNITRDGMAKHGYCPSGRFFEAAACGTPLVSDRWAGIETFFADDEIFLVESADEVLSALELPDDELKRVAGRARQRTLHEHTGDRRARELIGYMEEARRGAAQRRAQGSEVAS